VNAGSFEEWFGEHVSLEVAQHGNKLSHRFSAVLESADERGLVVSWPGGDDLSNLTQRHTFFPWQNVRWVQLLTEGQDRGEEMDEGPGMSGS